jgi:Leucine rich repeat
MEDRDDDDNESAVRALNTAFNQQAESLKIFQEEPLLMTVNLTTSPVDEYAPVCSTSVAPSDESQSLCLDYISHSSSSCSSNVTGETILATAASPLDPPGTTGSMATEAQAPDKDGGTDKGMGKDEGINVDEGTDKDEGTDEDESTDDEIVETDEEEDDGIHDEVKNLRVSEILLRKEMERATQLAFNTDKNNSIEQLSSNFMEATEKLCAPQDAISVHEIRAHMAREQQKEHGTGCATIQGFTSHDLAFVDKMMETVMDTLMVVACPSKRDLSPLKPKTKKKQQKQKQNPKKSRATPFEETEVSDSRSIARSVRANTSAGKKVPGYWDPKRCSTLTAQEKEFVVKQLRNARTIAEKEQRQQQAVASKSGPILAASREVEAAEEHHDKSKRCVAKGTAVYGNKLRGRGYYDQESQTIQDDEEQGQEVFYQTKYRRWTAGKQAWIQGIFKKEWLGLKRVYWVICVVSIVSVILFGIILLLVTNAEEKELGGVPAKKPLAPVTSRPSTDGTRPSTNRTGTETDTAKIDFPMYTQAAFQDPSSPQSKAYEWLMKDPAYFQYSNDRKIQRFALASLYYSTTGSNWTSTGRALWYNSDECQWFYSSSQTTPAACTVAGGQMESLSLESNNLEGTIPPELWLMTNLKYLSLANNPRLMSTIPSHGLEKMTDLQNFHVTKCGLSGPLPGKIGYLENLERLDLSANRFTGTIPLEFRELSNLRELRLQKNDLNGTLPGMVLEGLTSLQQLYLFENNLEGSIPSEIKNLQVVEDVFLYRNGFRSTLPSELGLLTQLQRLWLDRNRFEGRIPEQLGSLSMMMQLSLSSNQLTGTIPEALANARSLSQIRLENTLLTGEVPQLLCSLLSPGAGTDQILSIDCVDVACDCDCNCPRPGSEVSPDIP